MHNSFVVKLVDLTGNLVTGLISNIPILKTRRVSHVDLYCMLIEKGNFWFVFSLRH